MIQTHLIDTVIMSSATLNSSVGQNALDPWLCTPDTVIDFPVTVLAPSPRSWTPIGASPPIPYLPPSPVLTPPVIVPLTLGDATNSQARKDTRPVLQQDMGHPNNPHLSSLFMKLVSDLFQLTKDGSLVFKIHRAMQLANEEHVYTEALRQQLSSIKTIAQTSAYTIATIRNNPTQYNLQSDSIIQSQRDLGSIILDAQASIAVIARFLTKLRWDLSSGSISYSV